MAAGVVDDREHLADPVLDAAEHLAYPMRHLEEVTGRIAGLGPVTTSVVYSSPLPRREVDPGPRCV